MAIQISDNIASASRTANLDAKFGPYSSKQAVIDELVSDGSNILAVNGLTVGVIEDNNVVEYVFKNVPSNPTAANVTVNNLFLKQVAVQEETDPTVPAWAKQETKPSYTASEVGAIPDGDKGVAGGVATLGSDGKVPQSQLPSYVDDVLEYSNQSSFPATGESGKIYVALDTNKTYRWSGSAYVEISQSLALGETSSTAFAGDRGKAIEDKIPSNASSSNKLATMADLPDATTDYGDLTNKPQINSVTLSGNKSASDLGLATAAQGAKADTAYQKPQTGIPSTDLASAVQTSLGKADSAVQSVTVGTTTTGAAGSNASVTNSGTSTAPVLDFTIPRGVDGADAVNPFKGWYTTDNIPATGQEGDYCNVSNTSVTPHTVTIYRWSTTQNAFVDTGEVPDTANGATFASSETLQEVAIDNSHLVNPVNTADSNQPVLSRAEDVMQLKAKLEGVTANEEKGSTTIDYNGYIVCKTSGSSIEKTYKYVASVHTVFIPIQQDTKKLRFLGRFVDGNTYTTGYAFINAENPQDIEDNIIVSSGGSAKDVSDYIVELHPWVNNGTSDNTEINDVVIPDGATYFCAVYGTGSITQSNFYCYLQSGDSAVTQEQLEEVRNAMPVVESFANKGANNIVLNEEIVKQLSLDVYEKIDVDVSNFNNGLRYSINFSTLKFGTNNSYSHVCVYVEEGDIIEIVGNASSYKYFYFLMSLVYGSGSDIPIVDGTEPIYVGKGERVTLQAPAGAKCIAFHNDSSTNPQSITIYRKKLSYDSKVYTADDYIMCNGLSGIEGNILYNGTYSKCFVIPIKAGFRYALTLTNIGTGNKIFQYLNRLPNIGDSYENLLGFTNSSQSDIATTFIPTYDGFLNISFSNTSYTADNISLVAVKSTVDMSDFVAPMLSKLKFNTPQYKVKSGGIYIASYYKAGLFTTSDKYKHILLKVTAGDVVMLKKGTNVIRYAFLKDDTLVNETLANFADGTAIMTSITDVLKIVPPTANYLYILDSYNSTSYLPSYIGILADNTNALTDDMQNRRDYNIAQATSVGLSKLNIQVDENGWELPATLQQLNAQKKAEQLCKIKWTPKHNVPSKISPYYYEANVEQTSIPYSSNNDDGVKKVGVNLSIHTFMTAVNNPYSLLYTECINNETRVANPTKASAWGKDYTKSGNGYAYYGTVCCGLTSFVENSPIVWNNTIINNYLKTNGLYIQICPTGTVDFNLLQIGDVADNTAHSFLIYGLHRDANGNVDRVKISEGSSRHGRGKCVINNGENRDNFLNRVYRNGSDPFTLFRYVKLWNNTDYEPSEYVPLVDRGEVATQIIYNDAICTFAGDKAIFRSDDLVVINYNLNGTQPHEWTKIKVYKDDVLLREYTLAEAEATLEAFYTEKGEDTSMNGFNVISQHNHALVLGTELAAGLYKACISDGTNDSDYTYWEVIPNTITVVEQGYDSYKVNVSGGFLEAIYVGNAYYLPTYDEQATNEFIIHPIALMQAWGLTYDGIDVRVKLKGKYGSVTTVGATVIEGDAPEPEPEPDDDVTNS